MAARPRSARCKNSRRVSRSSLRPSSLSLEDGLVDCLGGQDGRFVCKSCELLDLMNPIILSVGQPHCDLETGKPKLHKICSTTFHLQTGVAATGYVCYNKIAISRPLADGVPSES